jgi:hypothetical protein
VRAPPDRFSEKTFFELLPKRKLLAAVTLLLLLFVVVFAQRHADRAMAQLRGFFGPPPASQSRADSDGRRVRLAAPPVPGERAP